MDVSKIRTEPHAQGQIEVFRLANAAGAYVDVCNIGAGVTAVVVPDREGRMADVALGYRAYADYVGDGACFGKTPGRFANRIAGGRFTLDGKEYRLTVNNGPNHLHGGPTGFANRLDKTVPNPTDENVTEGVAQYKADGCDGLISIGGGSSHDCCKGIGILLSNGGAIYQYEGVDKVNHMLPHYIAINTTAGTASELTRFCVITDKERHVKMSIVDWFLTPNVAVNDPVLMVGMPPSLTAATGMDALTHAIEAYVSTNTTPMTDACAEQSIRLVAKYLRKAVANGKDMEAREGMAYAQYLAGMAFNNAGLGYVHAMAHQLGGFYSLPHGECNAILLPHVESFNLISRLDRFVRIAQMMGECTDGLSERAAAELAISAIKTLSKDP